MEHLWNLAVQYKNTKCDVSVTTFSMHEWCIHKLLSSSSSLARSQRGRSVSRECPREKARLQRSAGGVLLSLWSWSSHLFLGRPGRRLRLRSGGRPSVMSTWHRRAWWVWVSSVSLVTAANDRLRHRTRVRVAVRVLQLVYCVCGPASGFCLSGVGNLCPMLPFALYQQLTLAALLLFAASCTK